MQGREGLGHLMKHMCNPKYPGYTAATCFRARLASARQALSLTLLPLETVF